MVSTENKNDTKTTSLEIEKIALFKKQRLGFF
jgi:hypothetical protein